MDKLPEMTESEFHALDVGDKVYASRACRIAPDFRPGPCSRDEVYAVVDGERDYQDSKAPSSDTNGLHTVTEFATYMRDYIEEATHVLSRTWGLTANEKALHIIRKVTALGVACMEQNGAPRR